MGLGTVSLTSLGRFLGGSGRALDPQVVPAESSSRKLTLFLLADMVMMVWENLMVHAGAYEGLGRRSWLVIGGRVELAFTKEKSTRR